MQRGTQVTGEASSLSYQYHECTDLGCLCNVLRSISHEVADHVSDVLTDALAAVTRGDCGQV